MMKYYAILQDMIFSHRLKLSPTLKNEVILERYIGYNQLMREYDFCFSYAPKGELFIERSISDEVKKCF
jgi:hypothetical protein